MNDQALKWVTASPRSLNLALNLLKCLSSYHCFLYQQVLGNSSNLPEEGKSSWVLKQVDWQLPW